MSVESPSRPAKAPSSALWRWLVRGYAAFVALMFGVSMWSSVTAPRRPGDPSTAAMVVQNLRMLAYFGLIAALVWGVRFFVQRTRA